MIKWSVNILNIIIVYTLGGKRRLQIFHFIVVTSHIGDTICFINIPDELWYQSSRTRTTEGELKVEI